MPIAQRLPLVERLHEYFSDHLAGGGSPRTVKTDLGMIRAFFAWCDSTDFPITVETAEKAYIAYTEHLQHLVRTVKRIEAGAAYGYASSVAHVLDCALGRKSGLLFLSRITKSHPQKRALATEADKKRLQDIFSLGHALLDIVDTLTVEAIRGPLPLTIHLRSGQTFDKWCGLIPSEKVRSLNAEGTSPSQRRRSIEERAAYEKDLSNRKRYPLINLRVEAEMMIFIAQSGMNLAQAATIRKGNFRYQSYTDGYRVYRVFKGRRQGEVEFEIYKEYKPVFERYLTWRDVIFEDETDSPLFPVMSAPGRSRSPLAQIQFAAVKARAKKVGIPFFGSRTLRKTRVNWLLRHTKDPEITAEMAQHSQKTLIGIYGQPHHQVAAIEISRFLIHTEKALAAPGPGACVDGAPVPLRDLPPGAPLPDCISPAGCLFCGHQRDIDSADHVWSLATYRHYKSLELAGYRIPVQGITTHPALAAIERVTAKLTQFKTICPEKNSWVVESLARVDEGDYHPKWDAFIQLLEHRA